MVTGSFQPTPTAHVRGSTAYTREVEPRWRWAARFMDATLGLGLVTWIYAGLKIEPRASVLSVALAAALPFAVFVLLRLALGRSAGDAGWGLAPAPGRENDLRPAWQRVLRPHLVQPGTIDARVLATGIFLTAASLAWALSGLNSGVLSHPLWRTDGARQLDAAMPADSFPATRWAVGAFYYSLGAWPTEYRDQPVFHLIPYEKGPPERFPGKVFARWDPPYAVVMIEGPKTPAGEIPRDRLRECILHSFLPGCARVRDLSLSRHIAEIQSALGDRRAMQWKVQWLTIRQPALPEAQWTQGFWIEGRNATTAQHRFVAITPNGTHEAFALTTQADAQRISAAAEALTTFERALQGLRFSDQLGHGRVWIDQRLSEIRLAELERTTDPAARLKLLAEVQFLLAAKITVEPGEFATYYHYGGLGTLLLRHASLFPADPAVATWTTAAKPTIEAAAQFARDLAPEDARTKELAKQSREAGR